MKRGLLGLLPIFFINFVSAQFFSGYGRFSLGNFFDRIDPQTMILGLLFLIFVLILHQLVFMRLFNQNRTLSGVASFLVSLLIIYGLYTTRFDFTNLFYDLGLSSDSLYIILPIILIIGAIIASLTIGLGAFLAIVGVLLILLTVFTNFFYEKFVPLALGVLLLVIGWWRWGRRRRRDETGGGRTPGTRRFPWRRSGGRTPSDGAGPSGAGPSWLGGGGAGGGKTRIKNVTKTRGDTYRSRTRGDTTIDKSRRRTRGDTYRSRTRGDVDRPKRRWGRSGDTNINIGWGRKKKQIGGDKPTRREAKFYISIRHGDVLSFNPNETQKYFQIGNQGGGRIKWNAHSSKYITITPNGGTFGPDQVIKASISVDRSRIRNLPATGAIGIHTIDRKRNKFKFSARVVIN